MMIKLYFCCLVTICYVLVSTIHHLFMRCYTYITIADPQQESTADELIRGQSVVKVGPLDKPTVCCSLLKITKTIDQPLSVLLVVWSVVSHCPFKLIRN